MSEGNGQKSIKTQAAAIGGVVLALGALFAALGAIPYATKDEVQIIRQGQDKEIAELKERQKLMELLKKQDNDWYREVAEDVAVVKGDVSNMKDDLAEIKSLLRERR